MAEIDFQAGELDGVEGGSGVGSHDEHADANAVSGCIYRLFTIIEDVCASCDGSRDTKTQTLKEDHHREDVLDDLGCGRLIRFGILIIKKE